MNKTIIKSAFINAIATAVYIIAVASFMYYGQTASFGNKNIILMPIAMLMLFVFSAAFTAILIFGRPVMLYLDGKKNDALLLLACTLGIFLLITILVFFILIFFFT